MGSNVTFIFLQLTWEEEVWGLRNILFKDRVEEVVGVIASLSADSLMPGEKSLSWAKLNLNMSQDTLLKVLSLPCPHSPYPHILSPWQLLSPLTKKISAQYLLETLTTKLIQ